MKFYAKLGKKALMLSVWCLFAVLLILPKSSMAENDNGEKALSTVYLPANTVNENVYWAAGQNINLNAQMKDDVYLAGANIFVNGLIEGDLIAVGSNVVINSEVKGNLRIAAASVTIKGKVGGNLTVLAGLVSLSKEAEVGKNIIVLGGNVELYSKINKNLYGAVGNIFLNNEILGSAYLNIDPDGAVVLFPETNIHGNLEYSAVKTAEIQAGARVQSEEKFNPIVFKPEMGAKKIKGLSLTFWLISLLGSIIVGLILVYLLKETVLKVNKQLSTNILMKVLKGLICLVVMPIALVILAVTIIGAPLAMILAALYFVALYLTKIFVGIFLGETILKLLANQKDPQLVWSMILGLLLIFVICLIPYLGWIIKLFIVLWGLGALALIVKKELNLENK